MTDRAMIPTQLGSGGVAKRGPAVQWHIETTHYGITHSDCELSFHLRDVNPGQCIGTEVVAERYNEPGLCSNYLGQGTHVRCNGNSAASLGLKDCVAKSIGIRGKQIKVCLP